MIWEVKQENVEALIDNLNFIFQCIRNLNLKLAIDKCQFRIPKTQFLGHTISAIGTSPNKLKVEKFLQSVKFLKTLRHVRRLIGFMQYFEKFIPNLTLKLHPFFQLLRKESSFHIKADLVKACNLSWNIAKPHCQFIIVCDASFYAAGFILLIEQPHDSSTEKSKTYATVQFT